MSDVVLQIVFLTAFASMFTSGVFGVLSYIVFDRLLRQVCAESEEAWIKPGKPCGFFYVPTGTRVGFKTSFVRSDLFEKWAAEGVEPFAGSAVAMLFSGLMAGHE
jgi:hypothetical protein